MIVAAARGESPRGRRGRLLANGGFSLLEVIVALTLVTLIVGFGFVALRGGQDEQQLREQILEVERFAKLARNTSIIQKRPYQIIFEPGLISLQPAGWSAEEAIAMEFEDDSEEDPGGARSRFRLLMLQHEVPANFVVEVRGWQGDWVELNRRELVVWEFLPGQLVEPFSVRISNESGWIEHQYNPLTGAMAEEDFLIR